MGKTIGFNVAIGGDTSKLNAALKQTQTQINTTSKAVQQLTRLTKFDPSNTMAFKAKQAELGKELQSTKDKLEMLNSKKADMDKAFAEGKISTKEWTDYQFELKQTADKLKELEKQTRNYSPALEQMAAKIGQAGAKLEGLGGKIKGVGDKISGLGSSLTTKVTAPLVAAGTVAVAKFAEVDKTMALTNKTMGNTKEQAQLLSKSMKSAAANSTYGMGDAAQATLNFARAGLKAEEAAAALAPSMNLAAGEAGDLDTVSAGLVATINGFHDSFASTGKYADVFANACNNSALEINSLSSSMSVAAPIFAAAGYSVQDAALYLGTMANAGIEASVGANALKTGLARLLSPSKGAAVWMDRLKISVTDSTGKMKDAVTVQAELHDAFAGLSEAEQISAASAIFGKTQMSNWLALINSAPEEVQALNLSLGQTGTTSEMASAMMSGFGGSIEKLKSSIDVAATSFGEALAPSISKVADKIQGLTDWYNSLDASTQTQIANIALIIAAIGPVILIVGKLVSGIGTIISTVGSLCTFISSTLIPAISALGAPVIAIIAVIGAVIAVLVHLYTTNEEFRDKVNECFGQIFEKVGTVLSQIMDLVQSFIAFIQPAIDGIMSWLGTAIGDALTNMTTIISGALDLISGLIDFFAGLVTGDWSRCWSGIQQMTSGVLNMISGFISGILGGIKNTIGGIISAIVAIFTTGFNTVKNITSNIFNGLVWLISQPLERAKSVVRSIIDAIKGFFNFSISWPHIPMPHFSIRPRGWDVGDLLKGKIPRLGISWYAKAMDQPRILDGAQIFGAMNGKLLGGGEKGREVVMSEEQLKKMGGGTTYQTNNITIVQREGEDEESLAKRVVKIIKKDIDDDEEVFA